jgi:two-component system sensor histidine kinase PhoQ
MTLSVLPIIGFTLSNAFEQQLNLATQNELKAYSYSIFTVAEVENYQLVMPEQLLENQFNVSQSGLYAVISPLGSSKQHNNMLLWQSQSMLTVTLPEYLPAPKVGQTLSSTIELSGSEHILYSFSASFSSNGQDFPITLHLIKSQQEFLTALSDFRQKLWLWLFILMVVFIVVQVVWLLWTLKPLTRLRLELEHIEKGQQKVLEANYPLELMKVTQQFNTLLITEENQRTRYRNALSDLAHSLKNPLAVIQSQTNISDSANEQLQRINHIVEHQLKRAQSAGQSSWHLGVPVNTVTEKLIKTLAKIYQDKQLSFNVEVAVHATFRGDEADLMEMLGNLLDNACKAAVSQVSIKAITVGKKLTIEIADDGQGIDKSEQALILSRGGRADTYQLGHGIGLAIVNDLITSYQGQLSIGKSSELSGASFTLFFE